MRNKKSSESAQVLKRGSIKSVATGSAPHRGGTLDRKLSDEVTLSRQFQRAVRLDTDFGSVEALRGYICQGTARNVLEATARHVVQTPQRAFIWTGPYGGGKSSLAVALCSLVTPNKVVRRAAMNVLDLAGAQQSDIVSVFSATKDGWLVLPVVGHRGSVVDAVSSCLDEFAGTSVLRSTKSGTRQRIALLFKALAEQAAERVGNGVLLVIDELGKFLEAASGDGDDIYFYQELADLAGRCKGRLIVVGILHQSFEQYAHRLGSELRDEWRKVQGRYIDIPLVAASDEVVELTGRAIHTAHAHPESLAIAMQVAQSIRHHRPGLSADFADRLDRCWPLHPVTVALLGPVSKRRFGQNERSTFGFLASAETRSFREFLQTARLGSGKTYTPAAYWDYLRTNLEPSILASTDSHRWSQSVEAVERTEQKNQGGPLHVELVKTIALIDLFRNGSGLVADDAVLGACVCGADGAALPAGKLQELLQDLRRWALVSFKRHQGSWAISEGSDFDLDAALAEALGTIDEPDLSQLTTLVRLQPVLAKRHYCETGTLRWMVPLMAHANQFVEGLGRASLVCGEPGKSLGRSSAFGSFLLVLPARGQTVRQAANLVRKLELQVDVLRPILVGVPRNGEAICELSRELMAYDRIRRLRSELENDAVARRELEARTTDVRTRLEEELRDALLRIHWINGDSLGLPVPVYDAPSSLAHLASAFADVVFSKSPHVFSELINRDLPSSNSTKARKDLLYAMLGKPDHKRLGLEGYPAEAGLYHNLLEASGLHRPVDGEKRSNESARYAFSTPVDDKVAVRAGTFAPLWAAAVDMVIGAPAAVPLSDLYRLWQAPPYGVRGGVLPVLWLAFALANQHRMAVYKDGMFVPQIRPVDVDEALQDPSRFAIRHVQINEHRRDILKGVAKHLRKLALAVYMRQHHPELKLEYFFTDTGKELPEVYEFLGRLEGFLGQAILRLNPDRDFDFWLREYGHFLPSASTRWCTRQLKLLPFRQWVRPSLAAGHHITSYVAIRADEDYRQGFEPTQEHLKVVYPFREAGIDKQGVIELLGASGLGLPRYYEWRSRSGCTFCFFQQKIEWVNLKRTHPDAFEDAKRYEKSALEHGSPFTWSHGESLLDLEKPERIAVIEADFISRKAREQARKPVNPLRPIRFVEPTDMDELFGEDEGGGACLVCHK